MDVSKMKSALGSGRSKWTDTLAWGGSLSTDLWYLCRRDMLARLPQNSPALMNGGFLCEGGFCWCCVVVLEGWWPCCIRSSHFFPKQRSKIHWKLNHRVWTRWYYAAIQYGQIDVSVYGEKLLPLCFGLVDPRIAETFAGSWRQAPGRWPRRQK